MNGRKQMGNNSVEVSVNCEDVSRTIDNDGFQSLTPVESIYDGEFSLVRKGISYPSITVTIKIFGTGNIGPIIRIRDETTLEEILRMPVKFSEPDKAIIKNAAVIKGKYRLSYADAFAIALAKEVSGILLTGDPEILLLKNVVKTLKLKRN